jgi:hypothetical protein
VKSVFANGQHLVRAAVLLLAGVGVFLVARAAFVPKGFGTYGHYRAGALLDNQNRPLHFAGRAACEECHTDVVAVRHGSKHERIGCEACHGPQAAHAADPGAETPKRPDAKTICLRCHMQKVTAPASFPQVNPKDHGDNQACNTCHPPHHPEVQ